MRILGIDPGLRRCGWGVVDHLAGRAGFVACGVITPPTDAPLPERLAVLHHGVAALIVEHAPDEAAIEDTFVNANPASALKLGHARAAAMLAPAVAGLTVAEYGPKIVKQAVTGKGGAEKDQVATMVRMLLPGCRATADAADEFLVDWYADPAQPPTAADAGQVAWLQPVSAASIWPVAFMSLSMACLPQSTRPGCSSSITAFSSLATASGSMSVETSSAASIRIGC